MSAELIETELAFATIANIGGDDEDCGTGDATTSQPLNVRFDTADADATLQRAPAILDRPYLDALFRQHQAVRDAVSTPTHDTLDASEAAPPTHEPVARERASKQSVRQRLKGFLLGARKRTLSAVPVPSASVANAPLALPSLIQSPADTAVSFDDAFESFKRAVEEKILAKPYRSQVVQLRDEDAMSLLEALQTVCRSVDMLCDDLS
jgi:hypothetical protein